MDSIVTNEDNDEYLERNYKLINEQHAKKKDENYVGVYHVGMTLAIHATGETWYKNEKTYDKNVMTAFFVKRKHIELVLDLREGCVKIYNWRDDHLCKSRNPTAILVENIEIRKGIKYKFAVKAYSADIGVTINSLKIEWCYVLCINKFNLHW